MSMSHPNVHKRSNSDPTGGLESRSISFAVAKKRISSSDSIDVIITNITQKLSTTIRKYGEYHRKVAVLRNKLGNSHFQRKDFLLAEKEYQQALAIARENFGPDDAFVATILCNLGTVYWRIESLNSSIFCFKECLRINKILSGGSDVDKKVAETYHNLGMALFLKKNYDKAQRSLERALESRKKLFGIMHVDVARTLDILGKVFAAKEEIHLALGCHTDALRIKTEILGEENPSTIISLVNVAQSYRCDGNLEMAIDLYDSAVKLQEKNASFDDNMFVEMGITLHILGDLYVQKSDHFDALMSYKESSYAFDNARLDKNDKRILDLERSMSKAQRLLETSDLFLINEQNGSCDSAEYEQ